MIHTLKRYQHLIYPVADAPLHVVNYLFVVVPTWYLTVEDYGKASALVAMLMLLFMVGLTFQSSIAKMVSGAGAKDLRPYAQIGIIVAAVVGLAFLLGMPLLVKITHSNSLSITLVYAAFCVHILLSILRGVEQGGQHFASLNVSLYIEAFGKITLLLIFMKSGGGYATVLVAVLIAMGLSTLFHLGTMSAVLKGLVGSGKSDFGKVEAGKDVRKFLTLQAAVQYFITIDIILLNYLRPEIAGYYAVLAKYGQLIMYVALSVQVVLLPILNRNSGKLPVPPRYLISGFALLAMGLMIVYRFIVPITVDWLFGAEYTVINPYLPLIAMSYLLLATVNILFLLILLRRLEVLTWIVGIGMASITTLYLLFYGTIDHVILAQITVYSGLVFLALVLLYRHQQQQPAG